MNPGAPPNVTQARLLKFFSQILNLRRRGETVFQMLLLAMSISDYARAFFSVQKHHVTPVEKCDSLMRGCCISIHTAQQGFVTVDQFASTGSLEGARETCVAMPTPTHVMNMLGKRFCSAVEPVGAFFQHAGLLLRPR